MKKTIILLILLLSNIYLFSQENYKIQHITTIDGLPQSDINDMIHTKDGKIWICTNDGLSEYNGYSFKTYTIGDKGLKTNLFLSVAETNNNNLLVGTTDKGIYLYDNKLEKFFNVYNDLLKKYEIKGISFLFIDHDNNIWFSSKSIIYKIHKIKGSEKSIIHSYNIPIANNTKPAELIINSKKRIVFQSIKGIYIYNEDSDQIIPYIQFWFRGACGIQNVDNTLYIGTKNKILTLNPETNEIKEVCDFHDNIDTYNKLFTISKDKTIWITSTDGFYAYNIKSHKTISVPNCHRYTIVPSVIFEDNFGVIWSGSLRDGIYKIMPNNTPFKTYYKGKVIQSLLYTKNKELWIGNINKTISYYPNIKNLSSEPITFKNQEFSSSIFYLFEDTYSNKIFVCSGLGLRYFDHSKKNHYILKSNETLLNIKEARYITRDQQYLWIGTYNSGIYIYDLDKEIIIKHIYNHIGEHPLPSNIIRYLLFDKNKNLWIGSDNGIAIVKKENLYSDYLKCYFLRHNDKQPNNSLSFDYILPIKEAKNGDIYIGTLGGGLNRLTPLGNFQYKYTYYSTKNGLRSNTIKAIEEDSKHNIWISTNTGLHKLNPNTNKITYYGINDGMQSNEFCELSSAEVHNEKLLFGGVNGFNIFNPSNIKRDTIKPHVILSSLQILNKDIEVGTIYNHYLILKSSINVVKKIKLPYRLNSFSLSFASINSIAPQKSICYYKLKNFDETWNKADNLSSIAKYTNIPAGRYIFQIKADNGDGYFSNVKTLNIRILPAFMFRWYALLFYLIIISYSLIYALKVYNKKQKRRAEILIMEKEKEQIQRIADMKTRFFNNVAHELRTPLTLISSPVQTLLENSKLNTQKREEYLQTINYNCRILLRFVNNFLDFSKQKNMQLTAHKQYGNIAAYCKKVFYQFNAIAEKKDINLMFFCESDEIMTMYDPYQMQEIIYNLVSNAVKNTIKGYVSLEISETDKNIQIIVNDTGSGIPIDQREKIFERYYVSKKIEGSTGIGLHLTKSFIEQHDGTIKVEDNIDENNKAVGSSFIVNLPKKENNLSQKAVKNIDKIEDNILSAPLKEDNEMKAIVTSQQRKPTVLVVDDNPTMTKLLYNLLSNDYDVIEVNSAEEALKETTIKNIALIISDVMMPVTNGIELCEKIKSNIRTSHIPVILLSALETEESQVAGFKAKADAYVFKPFTNKVLLSRVKSIIDNRSSIYTLYKTNPYFDIKNVATTDIDKIFIEKIIKLVNDNMSKETLNVKLIANHMKMSQVTLNKKLVSLTGQTTATFIRNQRLSKAAEMLKKELLNISEITYKVGFNDVKYFRKCFKNKFGLTPSEYKKQ